MSNNNKKILIIEDEEILLNVLSKKIKDNGFDVLVARDGENGLAQIKSGKPDLILLDMLLPKLDGFGVLEKLKENKNNIPIVIISNSGQPVDVGRALKLGAYDYLIKAELSPDEIIEKVHHCLINIQNNNRAESGAKKILVVEDDKFLRDLCVKKLNQMNFCVDSAINGIEGLEKIIKDKPDLVLLDIIMPGMEGFEILERVRADKNEKIAKIPIIMLSNLGQETDVKKAMLLGANDYLIKAHFTIDDIINKISKYL
ncbi:MAG: response regulator [Patescibacteria group bacterium]|nr:response regulator [Patescibacteria group bacterium]